LKVEFVTGETFGTRSMATVVKKKGKCLFIDPGVALAPWRSGLRPHPIETERKEQHWLKIKGILKDCDYVVITHYHFDHFNIKEPEVFRDKIVFLKDPDNNINWSQHKRAFVLLKNIRPLAKEIRISDGLEFDLGWVRLKFSHPVFHGATSRLGYVTEVFLQNHTGNFLFTSDVQGPIHEEQTEFIIKNSPEIVYVDGPMIYLLGNAYSEESLKRARKNLKKILQLDSLKTLIIDHHMTRSLEWEKYLEDVFEEAEKMGKRILTAAEFMGEENTYLEARRKDLYKLYPVDKNKK